MRLGVVDIGSNTVHLLIASIHPGGRPVADSGERSVVRLMRYLDASGAIAEEGIVELVDAEPDAQGRVGACVTFTLPLNPPTRTNNEGAAVPADGTAPEQEDPPMQAAAQN